MNLLAGTYYDPGTAVSKATTALLAMTALDTTNLRLTFTAPPSGRVRVRIAGGCIHGATTFPMVLIGCLENSPSSGTVRGRMAPQGALRGTALATTQVPIEVDYIQTGLTPGQQYIWDAAYGVEIILASTGWKYGGPNNTTTNDAFGGISFEIWDPSPVYTAGSGIPPTTPISARLDTLDDLVDTEIGTIITNIAAVQADTDNIQTRLPAALVSGRMDASVGAMATDVITASAIAANAITDAKVASDVTIASVTGAVGSVTGAVGSVTGDVGGNVVGSVGSLTGYVAPDNASITAILADTAAIDARLPSDPADQSVVIAATDAILTAVDTRLAASSYTAPDNASVTAIKAKTDSLTFTSPGYLDVNILKINGITVGGSGTESVPWGPA